MKQFDTIDMLSRIKLMADQRRLAILKTLMDRSMTLSQLGRAFNKQPSWIRHHVKVLEKAGLVQVDRIQISDGYIEKYYQASARAYLLKQLIIPERPGFDSLVCLGSHDLGLELVFNAYQEKAKYSRIVYVPNGSLDGLIALRQGMAQFSGCHLFDPISGEYNSTFVRHFFPDRQVRLITLTHRTQGLIFIPGNPKQITNLADLSREDIRIVNRIPGSGTRIRFEQQIQDQGIPSAQINGYANEVGDHYDLVSAIRSGKADVGLGLQAAAFKAGLDFLPLFSERYDLVIPLDQFENPEIQRFFESITAKKSRKILENLPGYDPSQAGTIVRI
jgi:putative molybdopterin biosynthesis protein